MKKILLPLILLIAGMATTAAASPLEGLAKHLHDASAPHSESPDGCLVPFIASL